MYHYIMSYNYNFIIFIIVIIIIIILLSLTYFFFRILAYSPEKLQFIAEILWAKYDNGNFWVMSSRFHKFFLKQVDTRQINIRIMRIKMDNQALISTPFNQQIDPYYSLNFYNNTLGL